MRKFIFLFIGCILSLISCHKSKENIPLSSEDPFVFNMSNYFDFLKQGRALILEDSDRVGYARVTEWINDSIIVNDSTKEVLKFKFVHYLNNLGGDLWYNNYGFQYIKDDSIICTTTKNVHTHRLYPTLEALKQMRKKMQHNPQYNTTLEFADDEDLLFEISYNKNKGIWETYITIVDFSKDSLKQELQLSINQFDSLIYKLDNIRAYLKRGGEDNFFEDVISDKKKKD